VAGRVQTVPVLVHLVVQVAMAVLVLLLLNIDMATLKNTTINDTGFLKLPAGTTLERPSSPALGASRYNSTNNAIEFYTSGGWVQLTALAINSVNPSTYNGESGTSFTVLGTGFVSGLSLQIRTVTGALYSPGTLAINNSGQLTFTTPQDFTVADEPLDIILTSPTGQSATLNDCIDCGGSPTWTTAAGTVATIYDSSRASYPASIATLVATDPDAGATVSYSFVSGSLPTNTSFTAATGVISRTGTIPSVVSDTTYSFVIRATDNAGNTADRTFNIIVKAPTVTSYTSTGAATFSVPFGVTSVRALVVAGGGAGGTRNSGTGSGGTDGGAGGGAGGMIDHPGYPVTPGGSIPINVGAGAAANTGGELYGSNGSNSTFALLTAIGGGGGGAGPGGPVADGRPGGSGGGRGGGGSPTGPTGTGTQPSQPGDSGTYGYGFPGGPNPNSPPFTGAGGGGAGGAGTGGGGGVVAPGGIGRISNITGSNVYYAGGGGGGGGGPSPTGAGSGGTGGGGSGNSGNATTNTGGGGGGGNGAPVGGPGGGGAGGPGIVILRY
jgi:hypothetical protein